MMRLRGDVEMRCSTRWKAGTFSKRLLFNTRKTVKNVTRYLIITR